MLITLSTITINNVLFSEGVSSAFSQNNVFMMEKIKSFIQFDHVPGMMVEAVRLKRFDVYRMRFMMVLFPEYYRDGNNQPG
jgi:hypothetical protein